ncbi:MAG: HdaA/DnaA family protein, partial [Geminicoccales bacterium]
MPLDLGHRPALGREDFLVAPCNEVAVAWIDRWPDWPAGGLAIYGPPGCGKSHLAEIWRAASSAVSLDLDGLLQEDPPARGPRTCVLDGVDAWLSGGKSAERERRLLHLYNL